MLLFIIIINPSLYSTHVNFVDFHFTFLSSLCLCVLSHSYAAYALEQTYTLMDHNNAIRLNVTFGDLNLNFYYLRHQPQEI